jgi:biopolymer transport protein TolQ
VSAPGGTPDVVTVGLSALGQAATAAGAPPSAPSAGLGDMTWLSETLAEWPLSQAAMGLLILFSVLSWGVIVFKWVQLRTARRQSDQFLDAFWQAKRLDAIYQQSETLMKSPISQVFRAGYIELARLKKSSGEESILGGGIENVERALRRAQNSESTVLESKTSFLATVGSTAPFIGLFGTVWGIMKAFADIGRMGSANLATVAPGISEALIATAIGLLAAIPAVIAFNFFGSNIRVLQSEMDSFGSDFLNIVKRHFFK